jgi:hypothetical protein
MRQGDLASALIQWDVLLALDPGNPEFQRQRRTIHKLIHERIESHLRLGEEAFRQKDFSLAKQQFLMVLALDPLHPQPPGYLRRIARDKHMMKVHFRSGRRLQE